MKPASPDAPCRIDGRPGRYGEATVALDDGTVQRGLGLFETLGVRSGRPLDVEPHLARLEHAVTRVGLAWPGRDTLRDEALVVAAELGHACGWLKVILTEGGRRFVFGGEFDAADEGRPVRAVVLPWRLDRRGPLTGLKTTSYAGHALGSRWAEARGADEGLWLNDRGHLAEGCRSSLFLIEGGALFTPAVSDGILPGVVRDHVLTAARARGMRIHEGKLRTTRIARAREGFLTSSVRGVRPLVEVDGRPIGDGRPGAVTATIAEAVRELRAGARGEASVRPT